MDSMPVTSALYTRRFIKQIEEEIPTLIKLQREGTYWDFKQQWHTDRSELKADIICLANNVESSTSYLIFGIPTRTFHRLIFQMTKTEKRNPTLSTC